MDTTNANVDLADFAAPPRAQGDPEAAFRRGFQQGAHEILYLIRNGANLDAIEAFIERPLRDWRHEFHTDAFPPAFKESD